MGIIWGIIVLFIVEWLIGKYAERKRIGFWGAFWSSLLLTPIVGLLVALLSRNKDNDIDIDKEDNHQPWKIYNDRPISQYKKSSFILWLIVGFTLIIFWYCAFS